MALNATERETIRRLRTVDGLGIRDIAAQMRRCKTTISGACREMGLSRLSARPRQPQSCLPRGAGTEAAIRKALPILAILEESGCTCREAGARLGLTKNQVIGLLWRAGCCVSPGADLPPAPRMSEIVARIDFRGCSHIAGDPRDIRPDMYCGAPVHARGLCQEHYARCWFTPDPKADVGPKPR